MLPRNYEQREAEKKLKALENAEFDAKVAKVAKLAGYGPAPDGKTIDRSSVNTGRGRKMLFRNWCTQFMAQYRVSDVTPKTVIKTESVIRLRLIPEFGNLTLDGFEPQTVANWLTRRYRDEGARWETVRRDFSVLKRVLNDAVRAELIPVNRAALAKLPKNQDKSNRTFLTPDEFKVIAEHMGEPERAACELLFATGMRKGKQWHSPMTT